MGNLSPSQYQVTKPLDHNWQQVIVNLNSINPPNYVLLRNKITREQAQQYQIQLQSSTLEDELRKYNLRAQQKLNLVTVKAVQVQEGGGTCSGVKHRLRVITERITHNLSAHPKLGYYEAIRVLLKILIGFKAIYQFEGYIQVHSNLIFFNQYGDVKVWMNQNLYMNEPEKRLLYGAKYGSEAEMVNEIFLVVEHQMINPRQFDQTKRNLITMGPISFEKAISYLSQDINRREKRHSAYYNNNKVSAGNDFIKQLQSKGLKVVNTRQVKRYVEEPGQIIYRQIGGSSQISYGTQKLKHQEQYFARNHYLSPQPIRNQSPIIESPQANYFAQPQVRNMSNERVSVRKQVTSAKMIPNLDLNRRIALSPPVGTDRSIRINLKQPLRQPSPSPSQNRQTIYYQRNINSSPSRISIEAHTRQRVVSASPYFHNQIPVRQQPPPVLNVISKPPILQHILPRTPYHIIHEPIVRKQNISDLQISKVSRISLSSHQSTTPSHKKLFSPKPSSNNGDIKQLLEIRQVETKHILDSSPNIKASVKQIYPSKNPLEPSIKLLVYPPEDDEIIFQSPKVQTNVILSSPDSVQTFAPKSPKNKHVGWVKIYDKEKDNYNFNKKHQNKNQNQINQQKSRSSVGGTFTNNNFSYTDINDSDQKNYEDMQDRVTMLRQVSDKEDQPNFVKQTYQHKYLSNKPTHATIHYDATLVKPNNTHYNQQFDAKLGSPRQQKY